MENRDNPLPILLGAKKNPDLDVLTKVSDQDFSEKLLLSASAAGDAAHAQRLLLQKANVDSKDHGGRTALHLASGGTARGAEEVVKILLGQRALANAVDHVGMTPLDMAMLVQNWGIKKLLEQNGVELQPILKRKAQESSWLLKASELKLRREIGHTLKSVVHLADWHGTKVVVKCIKMKRRVIMNKMKRSKSFDLSLASELHELDDVPVEKEDCSPEEAEIEHMCSEELLREIELLSSLRHPDLVLFLGACLENDMPVMFVTEYMPEGDLEHYLYKMRDERQVPHYAPPLWRTIEWSMAVARALAFLHKFPVIHRDLKPLNLLLTKTLEIKVTDFGTSKLMAKAARDSEDGSVDNDLKHSTKGETQMTLGVGTYNYMAPEVVRTKKYDEKVDIYALALIMFYLSSGKRPFYHLFVRGQGPAELLERFAHGEDPRPDARQCHRRLRGLIERGWAVKASERPSAKELLEDLEEKKNLQMPGVSCQSCTSM
ncbi:unnamed protein product [Durusdinium trenchii]|uniref:Protein kinase domain-containing protein n=1 Tax=Durusdinium trenchii TaxID=1381693 RepID=A0ABP0M9R0_9DINO